MYAAHFGLAREPFSLAPDPHFLFMSERHREALAHLLYGVRGGGGFVLLTGEIGAGKTTIARGFLEQLPAGCVVAYVFNPQLSALELLQTLLGEFGLPPLQGPERDSLKAHIDALNRFLLEVHAQGRQALVVIDEAQALRRSLLEQLRLLTNLETAERKLLQIVLIGQPELRERIAGLEQLAQRVVARYHLGALTSDETAHYVEHRLGVAGLQGPLPFDRPALKALHERTGGVPRRINLLADRALLGAYSQGQRQVSAALVQRAAAEVFDTPARPPAGRGGRRLVLALLGMVLVGLVAAGWWLQQPRAPQAVAAVAAVQAPAAVAVSPAPAASASTPDKLPAAVVDDPAALRALAQADEAQAWRELALHWNVAIGEGDPCVAARQAALACFRSAWGCCAACRARCCSSCARQTAAAATRCWWPWTMRPPRCRAAGNVCGWPCRCWPAPGAASSPRSGARHRAGSPARPGRSRPAAGLRRSWPRPCRRSRARALPNRWRPSSCCKVCRWTARPGR
jgi:general secretion pathway protein A